VGAGQAADSQRLTFLEQECARLQSDVDNERKERVIAETVFRERVRQLEPELGRLQGATFAMSRLRERLAAFESGAVMVDLGRRLMSLQTTNEQLLDDVQGRPGPSPPPHAGEGVTRDAAGQKAYLMPACTRRGMPTWMPRVRSTM
jgi:hypothetical protein